MMFDVGVQESITKRWYCRVHDSMLSKFVRDAQDKGVYIFSVIPLFRPKMKDAVLKHILMQDESAFNKEEVEVDRVPDISETYFRKDIDPRLLKTVSKEPPYVPIDSIGE